MFSKIFTTLRKNFSEPALRKLRNRLLAINLISLTLVVVVAFSIIYIDFYNRTQNEIDSSLSLIPPGVLENFLISQQVMAAATSGPDSEGDETVTICGDPMIPVDYSKSFVVNIQNDGSIDVFSMLDIKNSEYVQATKTVLERNIKKGELNMAGRAWQYDLKQASELVQGGPSPSYRVSIVFIDVEEAERGLRELALSLLIIGLVAIGAIFLISLFMANRSIGPVEESMNRQRRFIADASHELRTPIAVIAANAEAAKDAPSDDKRWINNIADEAYLMDGLVRNLLALARSEEAQINAAQFDLFDAIRTESDRVETFLFEKNIAFILDFPPEQSEPLTVFTDRSKVQSILSVLFENAVKYTPDGGHVTITAGMTENNKKNDHYAYISVSNTGAYIPPEDIEHVFDRFFRTDRSRNSETGGYGIGLSIAKEIARTLGGELAANSEQSTDGDAINTFTLYI